MLGTLYKIVNQVNNKVYIGKTYKSLDERVKNHIYDASRYPNRPLYLAFNKYGINNFKIECIGKFPEGELEEKEIEAIKEYDSYKSGYNATLGGDNNRRTIINEQQIIADYHQLKSMVGVAKKHRIGDDLVRTVIEKNNIEKYVNTGNSRKAKVTIKELNEKFESIADCARYLFANNYTQSKDITGIATRINRAIKLERPYLGLNIIRT